MKKTLLYVGLIVLFFTALPCQALSPIGPSIYGEKGQVSVGVDYFHSREDLKMDNYGDWEMNTDLMMRLQSSGMYANIGYVPVDGFEIYLRAGVSQAQNKGVQDDYNIASELEGTNRGLSGGGGFRLTKKVDNVTWGGQVQVMYHNFGFDEQTFEMYCFDPSISGKMKLYSAQLVLSALIDLNQYVSIYGGPVFTFTGGSADLEYSGDYGFNGQEELDVAERSNFGVHGGAVVNLTENIGLYGEVRAHASDGFGIACGGRFMIP